MSLSAIRARLRTLHARSGRWRSVRLCLEELERRTLPSTFVSAGNFPVGGTPGAVAVGDVNGDGISDIVTANSSTVSVLLGNGNGTFRSPLTFPSSVGSSFTTSVAIADINGDGRPDLVVLNRGESADQTVIPVFQNVSVLLGNGNGTFQPPTVILRGNLFGFTPEAVTVADVNRDNRPDLVMTGAGVTARVLLGNGNGTFQAPLDINAGSDLGTPDFNPNAVTVADINGDGSPDLVTANARTPGSVSVLLGNGDGTFQTASTFATSATPLSVAVADVNNDGKADLVTTNVDGSVNVLLGNGNGTFLPAQSVSVGAAGNPVTVADLNGDRYADLVIPSTSGTTVSVLYGNGDGTFQLPQTFVTGSNPTGVAVANVNRDGQPDLVVSNGGSQTVSVLLNESAGRALGPTSIVPMLNGEPVASSEASVSADGRFVAYLGSDRNAYVLDRTLGTTTAISQVNGLGPSETAYALAPVISADGNFIAYKLFVSFEAFTPDSSIRESVVLYDRQAGKVIFTDYTYPTDYSLSADGRYLTYTSQPIEFLDGGPTTNLTTVILYDRVTGTSTLLSHDSASSTTPANASSDSPVVSAAGNFVVFRSDATDLVPGQTGTGGLFLYNIATGAITLVSHASGSATRAVAAGNAEISADGNLVAFTSAANNLVAGESDTNGASDVFLYDQTTGTTTLVSHASTNSGTAGTFASFDPVLSGNGKFLAFSSLATNLVPGTTLLAVSGFEGVFLYDILSGTTTLVSHASMSPLAMANGDSEPASFSSDGSALAFVSQASNLVAGQPGSTGINNVFVYKQADASITEVSAGASLPPSSGVPFFNFVNTVYLFENTASSLTQLSQVGSPPAIADTLGSDSAMISGDGSVVVFIARPGTAPPPSPPPPAPPRKDDIVGRALQTGQWFVGASNGVNGFNTVLADAWNSSATWADVQTGDFNGDGLTDIVGRDLQSGQWFVGLSDGAGHFTTSLWDAWSPGVTWADVKVGDLTGNGKDDLIGRDLQSGQWWAAISNGSAFATSLWDAWSTGVTWVDVQIGDLNGDGKADIVGRALESGQWWAGLSTGTALQTSLWDAWSTGVTWVDVKIGDLNGDGKADIIGRALQTGQWFAGLSTGSSFSTRLWDAWSPGVTWVDVRIGDLNGDGKADLIGRALNSGQWWVSVSSGNGGVSSLWDVWSPNVTWVDVQLADFNGDGKLDLVGRALESGQWWVGLSTGTSLQTSLWDAWSTGVTWADVHHGVFV